ncbi:MAG: adenylosuccinate lyase [Lentimicrobiaceae bacterium]|nr:adenylosuccinate lyase [Lentimicrobiaceae bacterium]
MELTTINAISPVDGRYRKNVEGLAYYFSEAAFINYRVFIETEYFIALCRLPLPQLADVDTKYFETLRQLSRDFTFKDAEDVKEIEKTTNHDVKAVEYYLRKKFDQIGLGKYKEFIHFGLTSQDITNSAVAYSFKLFLNDVLLPFYEEVITKLTQKGKDWKNIPMIGRTHGQPATPTTMGKEIMVFAERLKNQVRFLKLIPFSTKFSGATGGFNAHIVAYPQIDWVTFADNFVKNDLGLERQKFTTQIEHYDNFGAFFDTFKRINTILLDLNRDLWLYVSINYFNQEIKPDEVGSSTMPHKINPIDFENAEGNIGIANAIFEHLSAKLPVSRLQRDLSDSTVIRNIGVPLAHSIIAIKSFIKGWNKLILNKEAINHDLENNWAVVSEAIQTILRREGYTNGYETLKALTRTHEKVDKALIDNFIDSISISKKLKEELKAITPFNYMGYKIN